MKLARVLVTAIAATVLGTVGYTAASHTQAQAPSTLTVAKASGYMKGYETLSWAPSALATGFVLYRDGVRVSTAGASATSARFSVSAGTHTISAVAILQSSPTTTPSTTGPATTTAPTTITAPTTTTAPAAATFEQQTAYAATPPPFNPARVVSVDTSAAFLSALANLRAGDLVRATGAFTVAGETTIAKQLASPALLDVRGVTFVQDSTTQSPSVYIHDASNVWLYGGNVHGPVAGQPGAGGIRVYTSSNVRWWAFHVHDVAHDGLDLFPVGGSIDGADFEGEIDHYGGYVADDPHAEKGTGFHGANIADAGTGIVTNSRVALYVHDGPSGAGVEIGDGSSSARITGITLILKAANLTKAATSQVAGNAVQWWGATPIQMSIPYLEASNLQGRATDGQGVYAGVSMHGITVAYGRATNTNLNPQLSRTESGIAATDPWDKRHGEVYLEVK